MARDFSKIKAGPCQVTYNSVDLGHTQGGVNVSYDTKWRDVLVDEYGETVVDKVFQGEGLEISMKLTQSQLATLKAIMPKYTAGATYLEFGSTVGGKLSSHAAQLQLHPFEESGTDHDMYVWKAAPAGTVVWGYTNEGDRVYEVTFVALVDTSKADGEQLFKLNVAD